MKTKETETETNVAILQSKVDAKNIEIIQLHSLIKEKQVIIDEQKKENFALVVDRHKWRVDNEKT